MQPGEVLNPDQSITSSNGRYRFTYQSDGNLVLYSGNTALWASNTQGSPVGVCVMQSDGNLAVHRSWCCAHLVLQHLGTSWQPARCSIRRQCGDLPSRRPIGVGHKHRATVADRADAPCCGMVRYQVSYKGSDSRWTKNNASASRDRDNSGSAQETEIM